MNKQSNEVQFLTEVPNSLKRLAHTVVRAFYHIEEMFIVDLLVRNTCMKEDDIGDVLRFEINQLRTRLKHLRKEKFLQLRVKMEPGPNDRKQRVNYYFINYRGFVNVVKYKLDVMRKRLVTKERDAFNRASFKCNNCYNTFTDLNIDQVFNFETEEFRCTYCNYLMEEEDSSVLLKHESRVLLARFNEQLEIIFDLLRKSDGINLAPELLEPLPVDIDTIRGVPKLNSQKEKKAKAEEELKAKEEEEAEEVKRLEEPVWIAKSAVEKQYKKVDETASGHTGSVKKHRHKEVKEDIIGLLLKYES